VIEVIEVIEMIEMIETIEMIARRTEDLRDRGAIGEKKKAERLKLKK